MAKAEAQLVLDVDRMTVLGEQIGEGLVRELLEAPPTLLPKQVDDSPGPVVDLNAFSYGHRLSFSIGMNADLIRRLCTWRDNAALDGDAGLLIRYGHDITIRCAQPTSLITMLTVREERVFDAQGPDAFHTAPLIATSIYRDLFGNACRRLVAPAGDLQMWGDGTVQDTGLHDPVVADAVQMPIEELPDEVLVYLLGSRYCETDRLSQIAWDLFQNVPPGWARAQAICDFAHTHIGFNYQDSSPMRSAFDVYQTRVGVCRDFAHLAIAFCRCMNMPARYVNGYLGDIGVPILDPMDYSAWIEVFLGGAWRTFDPRNNKPRIGRIVVAYGRDAADVPLIHSFGPHQLMGFRVWAYQLDEGQGFARLPDLA